EVTAVCSTRNVDLARSIGANHVIDYTQEDFSRNAGLCKSSGRGEKKSQSRRMNQRQSDHSRKDSRWKSAHSPWREAVSKASVRNRSAYGAPSAAREKRNGQQEGSTRISRI